MPNFLLPDFMVMQIIQMALIAATVIAVGSPLARALGKRLERSAKTPELRDVTERLQRIEQAVDTIALEVERSAEAQRYTAKLLTERAERK